MMERQRVANSEWRVERQRIASSQWRVDRWSGYQPRQNLPQRIANGDWRLVEQRSMFATRYSPLATRRLPRYSPFATRRRPAFTLTELLTVIAIIAILMGLLFTFYRPSQEQRKVFECQNRLVVIHRALRMYSLDWDGFPASPYDSLDNDKDGRFDEDPPDGDDDNDGQVDEDPVNGRDDDGDGKVDEDPPIDNDQDGKFNEDGIDAQVGGLLALDQYIRSRRTLICPSDIRAYRGAIDYDCDGRIGEDNPDGIDNDMDGRIDEDPIGDNYTSYQGCDTGTGFCVDYPAKFSQQYQCMQRGGVPTYAITRFPPDTDCHPSGRDDDKDGWVDEDPINFRDDDGDGKVDEDPPNVLTPSLCRDPDRLRQLGIMNVAPYYPVPTFPADDTVVTWCVHHRYIPNTTTPNYTKGGVPADLVLYLDGMVRIQQMRTPDQNWRRKPNEP
jgi:prepilin-type N-terminal cleavage/methylation domain-containing protein